MEIPIQVAVRIFPCVQNRNTKLNAPTEIKGDENGNPNIIKDVENEKWDWNRSIRAEKFNDNDNDNDDNDDNVNDNNNDDAITRHIVQTFSIPLASTPAGCFMVNGQLLDNAGSIAAGVVQVGSQSFPVTHALPIDITQSQIYNQTVFPLISLFLEGFDASVVTYGQNGTGKSYNLFGPGFDCIYSEVDQGIVQRCVRDIFTHMNNHPERTYAINIAWVEICGDAIRNLLGVDNVHCNSVADVFHWLQFGLNAQTTQINVAHNDEEYCAHSLFTLTLEQHWVSKENLIQHRLSTVSFSDLAATKRIFMLNQLNQPASLPNDKGLKALEDVVNALTDPALMYSLNGNVPYNQTTLTTLLKDSFGGRAQTLVILSVSPLECDMNETIANLQFVFKVQCVRNYVIMNTFSDDNTPITTDGMGIGVGVGVGADMPRIGLGVSVADKFGLEFAASQWFKLVSNAEGLFSKLINSVSISDVDKEQIEEWLFLKQECEDCLSSNEAIRTQKQLGPIQEADEQDEPEEGGSTEAETSCQQNSDNESESESQHPDLVEKLEALMEELQLRTDALVKEKHEEFIEKHPKAVMESFETSSNTQRSLSQQEIFEKISNENNFEVERRVSVGGRRRSIQPGASLSSAEIAMLNRVASREQQSTPKMTDEYADSSSDLQHHAIQLRAVMMSPIENLQTKICKLDADIKAKQLQMKEIEQTMQIKQNLITELVKNSETRTTAKQRVHKKKAKLEAEYEKTKKQLTKAMVQGKSTEAERLQTIIANLEQRLDDLASMKRIAGESGQNLNKLHKSLQESKKQIEELQKKIKKGRKLRDQLEDDLRNLKEKENTNKTNSKVGAIGAYDEMTQGKNLKEVQERISHLDHVLREKSENLELCAANDESSEQKEGLRHEIRNLRNTRDHLLKQRCALDRKLKSAKMLSQQEERKLLECDEAIEAIDAAIEFKNELICGHKSIDTSERLQREKGEQMLMDRLNTLPEEEMRMLLYKYFNKVIDLRDSSRKLEVQLIQLERERDAWEWKERVLSNAVRKARLEGEKNAVLLQRQHEINLGLMLRHLAEETSVSSASFSDHHHHQHHQTHHQHQQQQQQQQQQHHHQQQQRYMRTSAAAAGLALAPHQHQHQYSSPSTSFQYTDSEFDLDFYKNTPSLPSPHKMLKSHKHNDMEICPLPDSLSKYKPLDKIKDKERETKSKLFAKFQVLTRYAGQSVAVATTAADDEEEMPILSSGKKKNKEVTIAPTAVAIPQANLKRLMLAPPATKVTRQRNKIIIQDATRKN